MSTYGLIKATSRAMRSDTITDLHRINTWLHSTGKAAICVLGPSVRLLENSVALGIENLQLPEWLKLERGEEFYRIILKEIKPKEREKFNLINREK